MRHSDVQASEVQKAAGLARSGATLPVESRSPDHVVLKAVFSEILEEKEFFRAFPSSGCWASWLPLRAPPDLARAAV
jgi:hypothetical protein